MARIAQFFEEGDGRLSSMRLMSFLSLLYSFFFATYAVFHDKAIDFETLVLFVVAAFCPKVIQKFAETRPLEAGKP